MDFGVMLLDCCGVKSSASRGDPTVTTGRGQPDGDVLLRRGLRSEADDGGQSPVIWGTRSLRPESTSWTDSPQIRPPTRRQSAAADWWPPETGLFMGHG